MQNGGAAFANENTRHWGKWLNIAICNGLQSHIALICKYCQTQIFCQSFSLENNRLYVDIDAQNFAHLYFFAHAFSHAPQRGIVIIIISFCIAHQIKETTWNIVAHYCCESGIKPITFPFTRMSSVMGIGSYFWLREINSLWPIFFTYPHPSMVTKAMSPASTV